MGLPVRPDGLLDLDDALNWVARNVVPDADGGGASVVAHELLRGKTAKPARSAPRRRDDEDNPIDMAMNAALAGMFCCIPNISAAAARQAGASADVVAKILAIAHALARRQGNTVMVEMLRMDPRGDCWPDLEMCRKFTLAT
ncbi:MAG: hypothetical protein ACR65X_13105 [Methylocystis sp.]